MKKWILVLTMPSGTRWVLAERENVLALFPISGKEDTTLKQVFAFDSESEAQAWIKKTSSLSTRGSELMDRVKPELAEVAQ